VPVLARLIVIDRQKTMSSVIGPRGDGRAAVPPPGNICLLALAGSPRHVPCLLHHALGSCLLGWHMGGSSGMVGRWPTRPIDMPIGGGLSFNMALPAATYTILNLPSAMQQSDRSSPNIRSCPAAAAAVLILMF
jgi:hypothetical protein